MCTLKDYIEKNNVQHILLGNGFCHQISSAFHWNNIIVGCSEILDLQTKYNEQNLEILLKKCQTRAEKNHVIENFISYFSTNHPNGILTNAYTIKNYRCLIETLKMKSIFTINYDLSLYWLIVEEARNNDTYRDGFSKTGFLEYYLKNYKGTSLYYLHGAVFIYHNNKTELKYIYESQQIDNQIFSIKSITSQIRATHHIPVYVFESTSEIKKSQIAKFKYLKFCFEQLKKITGNICIYGTSIGNESAVDKHIIFQILANDNINMIHLGIHENKTELTLPKYLLPHKNKIKLFSSKEYAVNDNCQTGDKGPEQGFPDELMKETLKIT